MTTRQLVAFRRREIEALRLMKAEGRTCPGAGESIKKRIRAAKLQFRRLVVTLEIQKGEDE